MISIARGIANEAPSSLLLATRRRGRALPNVPFFVALPPTAATCLHAAELTLLGTLSTIDPNRYPPVAFGDALVLSADGKVAAGRDDGNIFYWTAESGMRHVPNYEGYRPTYVQDIYADGSSLLVDMEKYVGAYLYGLQALWSPTSVLYAAHQRRQRSRTIPLDRAVGG